MGVIDVQQDDSPTIMEKKREIEYVQDEGSDQKFKELTSIFDRFDEKGRKKLIATYCKAGDNLHGWDDFVKMVLSSASKDGLKSVLEENKDAHKMTSQQIQNMVDALRPNKNDDKEKSNPQTQKETASRELDPTSSELMEEIGFAEFMDLLVLTKKIRSRTNNKKKG